MQQMGKGSDTIRASDVNALSVEQLKSLLIIINPNDESNTPTYEYSYVTADDVGWVRQQLHPLVAFPCSSLEPSRLACYKTIISVLHSVQEDFSKSTARRKGFTFVWRIRSRIHSYCRRNEKCSAQSKFTYLEWRSAVNTGQGGLRRGRKTKGQTTVIKLQWFVSLMSLFTSATTGLFCTAFRWFFLTKSIKKWYDQPVV